MRWPWSRRSRTCQDEARKATLTQPDKVRLGFADGSERELDGADPHALALKAVADVLMRQDSV
jgi:hypothetical protein